MSMNVNSQDGPAAGISCLEPIDKSGLEKLIENGKADPTAVKTLKCKTVAEGRFRHLNYIRNLEPYIVDEPPGLLGDDTAPNPSEATLAALGSCVAVGVHANCVAEDITVQALSIELEADINITAVWGTGDTSPKPVGFDAVRIKVNLDAECSDEKRDEIIERATKWSPVVNTFQKPVVVDVTTA